MDLQRPDIYCKEVTLNPHHEKVIKICNEWFSDYMKVKWRDSNSMIICGMYMYPKCEDINLLVLIGKAYTFIIVLDDYLDKYPDKADHWLEVIERKKAITDDPIEKMYEILISELMALPLSHSQKLRILDGFNMYAESYKITAKIRNGELIPTLAEFTGCRYLDSFITFPFTMVEYELGINLDNKYHIGVFSELHYRMTEHIMIVNDIYSYKKETEDKDYPKYTYMSVVRQNSNLSREQALQEAVKRVERLDVEITDLITKVKSFADKIPNEYFERIIELKDGNLYWSKVCKRFKSF